MRAQKILLPLLILLAVAVLFLRMNGNRLDAAFRTIQPQTPESKIRADLGTPSSVDKSCTAYGTQQSTNCDHVLIYRTPLSFLTHSYWLVFIDAARNATATSHQPAH